MIDINSLTIGQAREIAQMFAAWQPQVQTDNGMIGEYVIVRCRDAGVHAGTLESYVGREAVLTDARRLWYHRPAGTSSWYEGCALYGLSKDSKVSATVSRMCLTETCDIVLCTETAARSIKEHPEHEQS